MPVDGTAWPPSSLTASPMNQPLPATYALDAAARASLTGMVVNGTLANLKITSGLLGNSYCACSRMASNRHPIYFLAHFWAGLRISLRPADQYIPTVMGRRRHWPPLPVACRLLRRPDYRGAKRPARSHSLASGLNNCVLERGAIAERLSAADGDEDVGFGEYMAAHCRGIGYSTTTKS